MLGNDEDDADDVTTKQPELRFKSAPE